jgi:hypothetical protein
MGIVLDCFESAKEFKYAVILCPTYFTSDRTELLEAVNWCKKTFGNENFSTLSRAIYFKYDKHRTIFLLRWG